VKVLPALDLRGGACVQLVGGSYDDERVRLPDPVLVSRRWAEAGLTTQHVVDLDAATGHGDHRAVIAELAREPGITLQVGGGVRDDDAAMRLADLGVARIVVGTRAVEDPAWAERLAARLPGRLIIAADVRGRNVVTRGWATTTALLLNELLARLAPLPIAGVLVTAVHVEGQLAGTDRELMKSAAELCHAPLFASGGVTTVDDLRALKSLGVAGAVVGMALYTGRLDVTSLAKEFP
jgi:phosphoribosylformimino-5-aminoimidazole carboxamide ribotide isomerase